MAKYLLYKINLTKKLKMSFVEIKNYQFKREKITSVTNLTIQTSLIMRVNSILVVKKKFYACYDLNNRLMCTLDGDGLNSVSNEIDLIELTNYTVNRGNALEVGQFLFNPTFINTIRRLELKGDFYYRIYDVNGNQRFMTDEIGLGEIENYTRLVSFINFKIYKGVATPIDTVLINSSVNNISSFLYTTAIFREEELDMYITYDTNGNQLFIMDYDAYNAITGFGRIAPDKEKV